MSLFQDAGIWENEHAGFNHAFALPDFSPGYFQSIRSPFLPKRFAGKKKSGIVCFHQTPEVLKNMLCKAIYFQGLSLQ